MTFAEKIKEIGIFTDRQPASDEEIRDAQEKLNVNFADDYREYLKQYGAASFYGHEMTGLCEIPQLNVINVTIEERERNQSISQEWYVIEQTHMDDIVIWQVESGEVFSSDSVKTIKICENLLEYVTQY